MMKHRQRKEKEEDRQRSKNSQGYIEAAVKLLPASAVCAFDKMLLVVLAHLRVDP
jgi:hypothetical protein